MPDHEEHELFNTRRVVLASSFLILLGMESIALMEVLLKIEWLSLWALNGILLGTLVVLALVFGRRTKRWLNQVFGAPPDPIPLFPTKMPAARALVVLVSKSKENNVALEAVKHVDVRVHHVPIV